MSRVYVDTCVLRIAWEAQETELSERAIAEISKSDVTYLYSRILELELLPQPIRNRQDGEAAFYRQFFDICEFVPCTPAVTDLALEDACRVGMSCADALHAACAREGRADELVTAEGPTKPLPKATIVAVRTIRT